MHINLKQALEKLNNSADEFIELFGHGSLSVKIYKPDKLDKQAILAGYFLFVKAGVTHRFINFTKKFSTWVFFMNLKEESKLKLKINDNTEILIM